MQTNFFSQIASMNLNGHLRLNIHRDDNSNLIVSVLLVNDQIKDKAFAQIPSLILNGNAEDMDCGFFTSITQPLQKNNSLLCNMAEHEKAMDKAKKESDAKRTSTISSSNSGKRKKFDDQMKKVNDLEAQKKYGQAISQLPKEKDFPEYAVEINKKMQELRGKHGSLSLFEEEPLPDSTDNTSEEPAEEDNELIDDNDDDDNDEYNEPE